MEIVEQLRARLRENVDQKTLDTGTRHFKEEIRLLGVPVSKVTVITREMFNKSMKQMPKEQVFAACKELWESGYHEEQSAAATWSYLVHEQYTPEDMDVFDRWLHNYVNNWASCDTLCNHSVGTILEMYPALVNRLLLWAHSDNRWVKRGAAVSLIIPARAGLFLENIFEIADLLLTDPDDLVQKGYGWMLKAASQAYPQAVFNYVQMKKSVMPRTALRYAIEKLDPQLRAEAMSK